MVPQPISLAWPANTQLPSARHELGAEADPERRQLLLQPVLQQRNFGQRTAGAASAIRVHAFQEILHATDLAGFGGNVAGKGVDGFVESAALHDLEHAPHRL